MEQKRISSNLAEFEDMRLFCRNFPNVSLLWVSLIGTCKQCKQHQAQPDTTASTNVKSWAHVISNLPSYNYKLTSVRTFRMSVRGMYCYHHRGLLLWTQECGRMYAVSRKPHQSSFVGGCTLTYLIDSLDRPWKLFRRCDDFRLHTIKKKPSRKNIWYHSGNI